MAVFLLLVRIHCYLYAYFLSLTFKVQWIMYLPVAFQTRLGQILRIGVRPYFQWLQTENFIASAVEIDVTENSLPADDDSIDASVVITDILDTVSTSSRRMLVFPAGIYYFNSTLKIVRLMLPNNRTNLTSSSAIVQCYPSRRLP